MIIRRRTAALAALLLLAGCTYLRIEDVPVAGADPGSVPTTVVFTAKVTGRAVVQWSDGIQTQTQTIDATGEHEWSSVIDSWRYVTAMTVVPVGAGSKASCLITVKYDPDDDDTWSTFTDKSSTGTKAAVCIQTGEADPPELGNPPTITVMGASTSGGGQYRVVTEAGNVEVENVKSGYPDEREFATSGDVYAVVVSTKAKDMVSCRIHAGHVGQPGADDYDMNSAEGLGAIATCHALVTR